MRGIGESETGWRSPRGRRSPSDLAPSSPGSGRSRRHDPVDVRRGRSARDQANYPGFFVEGQDSFRVEPEAVLARSAGSPSWRLPRHSPRGARRPAALVRPSCSAARAHRSHRRPDVPPLFTLSSPSSCRSPRPAGCRFLPLAVRARRGRGASPGGFGRPPWAPALAAERSPSAWSPAGRPPNARRRSGRAVAGCGRARRSRPRSRPTPPGRRPASARIRAAMGRGGGGRSSSLPFAVSSVARPRARGADRFRLSAGSWPRSAGHRDRRRRLRGPRRVPVVANAPVYVVAVPKTHTIDTGRPARSSGSPTRRASSTPAYAPRSARAILERYGVSWLVLDKQPRLPTTTARSTSGALEPVYRDGALHPLTGRGAVKVLLATMYWPPVGGGRRAAAAQDGDVPARARDRDARPRARGREADAPRRLARPAAGRDRPRDPEPGARASTGPRSS